MKKLVLAMACVLSLALLASCKQEAASSDVTVKNQVANQSYTYKGNVSGTFTPQKTESGKWVKDADAEDKLSTSSTWGYSEISWTIDMGDNYQDYLLTAELAYKADSSSDPEPAQLSWTIYKLGDKYYIDDYQGADQTVAPAKAEIKIKDDGSLEDDEFVITDLGIVGSNGVTWKVTDLKFAKWSE